jgi:hypothetical protein
VTRTHGAVGAGQATWSKNVQYSSHGQHCVGASNVTLSVTKRKQNTLMHYASLDGKVFRTCMCLHMHGKAPSRLFNRQKEIIHRRPKDISEFLHGEH